ncbi:MAG TPA: thioesterase [Bacillus sp. (in: firmicutes)]|uniref:thioesterase family protein n=1 Tax=Bacillus litorisediminis TaxID=2922713 RepID=UPI001FAD9965|nr:thioesterase [Bacillus litorisediminis]HWO78329.1 thioesterase [Bacillus sp. (in: firmicutes)]
MKEGLKVGQTATIDAVVTPDMYAQFEGKVVHPAYSTVSMVYHMEWAARQIILPFLEDHEEGMGGAVTVKHVAPTAAGTRITATAKLTSFTNHKVVTTVVVRNEKGIIGEGEVTQYILPKLEIEKKIRASLE